MSVIQGDQQLQKMLAELLPCKKEQCNVLKL